MAANVGQSGDKPKNPIQEIIQPFIDLIHAPRALWGINLAYVLEGLVYFGMLGYLAIHFSDFIFQGVPQADVHSHNMVMILTAGITISMLFFGFVPDKFGVRFALVSAFVLFIVGRVLISGAPNIFGLEPMGLWSPLHIVTVIGILFVVLGYGMYQPAAYAGVRQFTTPKTAAMGFAMLYALMNLGGWLPTFAFLIRDEDYLGMGIPGVFWVYTALSVVALIFTTILLSKKTVAKAITTAEEETKRIKAEEKKDESNSKESEKVVSPSDSAGDARIPLHTWLIIAGVIAAIFYRAPEHLRLWIAGAVLLTWVVAYFHPTSRKFIARHPLANTKFSFFIFALIPVQTLFTYNWLILPQYINRAFEGWIGDYFEIAANANPILIFILVPLITAATQKAKVYNMMIYGTFVMAAPAFLLAIGPYPITLGAYILIMTVGEAMWQPRFLQYAAEIAPKGQTGVYMGVAQFPWFLTKVLVPLLYSGRMMDRYCPAEGEQNTQQMWLIFGAIAITSTIFLVLAKGWVGKDFKTKSDD